MNLSRRTRRVALFVRAVARALFHGSADRIPSSMSVIIVAPTGKLGDVVCVTPVLSAIRAHIPKARLIVAGNSKLHRPLLADSGLVDEYVDLEEGGAEERIRSFRADAALVTGPSYESTVLLYLAGIPLVIAPTVVGGFSPSETRPYKILKRFIRTFPYRIDAYAPRERLKALEPLGIISSDTGKHLGFSGTASKKVDQFFTDNGIDTEKDVVVGISPSAGNKIKEWPEERFAEVADYLVTVYKAKIIVMGGPGDGERVRRTRNYLRSRGEAIEITDFNIDELKALIARLRLFIAVDTGPIYIAEAFGVPTIDIVGPVNERVQPPRGPIHRSVVPPGRERSEMSILNARSYDREEVLRQVLSITVPAVLREVDFLMRDIRVGTLSHKAKKENPPAC